MYETAQFSRVGLHWHNSLEPALSACISGSADSPGRKHSHLVDLFLSMSDLTQSTVRNRLLAKLCSEDFDLLQPHLEPVTLNRGDVLITPNQPIGYVCFIEAGITSVIATTAGGRRIEIGLTGRDGLAGTPVLLGVDSTPHETFMQIAGSGLRIKTENLRHALQQSLSLHSLLLRYVQTFTIQTSHTALSNGSHKIEERLARWLLMCHDRVDGNDLPLTHEFIALMLGVRRASVTEALNILEGRGIIRTGRGNIVVLKRAKLEKAAGDSYGVPEAEYHRLIGPFT
jgi:CRP-like cAMP-binding protein